MGSIEGLSIHSLKQFEDERGKVIHMLSITSPLFEKFGEIYFSTINPGVIKAWKLHQKMTQNITVPIGKIRLVIYDDRDGSKTKGETETWELGEGNYILIKIPPLLWYGFKNTSKGPSLIANCTDLPHDPSEQVQADLNDPRFSYKW